MEGGNKMTREEQIRQVARKYFDDYMDGLKGEVITVEQTFEDAAKWADKTMVEKACKWLLSQEEMIGISLENEFIERFKKAMEE